MHTPRKTCQDHVQKSVSCSSTLRDASSTLRLTLTKSRSLSALVYVQTEGICKQAEVKETAMLVALRAASIPKNIRFRYLPAPTE